MYQIILSAIKGIDNESSIKRVLLLWIGGVIWAFVNVAAFFFHKRFGLPDDLPATVVLYDFFLICGLAGLTVYERVRSKSLDVKKEVEVSKAENNTL